jgi:hypothetical protein
LLDFLDRQITDVTLCQKMGPLKKVEKTLKKTIP